eukprot:gb/GECG01008172.1/.p1 GENE.gb/GECG01008172.1/~~gb/GECG01008172.1/.p1  ORF type:complete len:236 (+),score=43.50 gb/GECG01008172.1/:1-708(+)
MAAPEAGTSGNVLFILTSHNKLGDTGKATGWYLPEVAHAYRVLKGHGFAVTFATPLGGEAPMDPGSFDNFKDECDDFLQDKAAKEALNNTKRLEDVNPDDYKGVYFPGGHGPMWDLVNNTKAHEIAMKVHKNGGIICAVCHGTVGIAEMKNPDTGKHFVHGKKVTSFTDSEEIEVGLDKTVPFLLESKLKENGADFQSGKNWTNFVAEDDRLICGQNPQSTTSAAQKMVVAMQRV